jgi:hypothetical protein
MWMIFAFLVTRFFYGPFWLLRDASRTTYLILGF